LSSAANLIDVRHEIESIKLGASRRIPAAALQEWVQRRREESKDTTGVSA
jgi:hypothetical protein